MNTRRLRPARAIVCAVLSCVGLSSSAAASPWNFVGARQQAMGGAGVAHTSDSTANYWNPANLAFQKGWGVHLPITASGSIENDALQRLSEMLVAYDQLDATAQSVFECAPVCPGVPLTNIQSFGIASLLGQFAAYGTRGENVHVGAALGLAGRVGSFGFSALSISDGAVFPNTDITNVALGGIAVDLLGTCATVPADCATPVNVTLGDQVALASAGGLTQQEGGHLVFLLEQAGADTNDPRVQQLATGLVDTASGALAGNETGALAAGLSVQEFAFSYAVKLPVPFLRKTTGTTRRILDTYVHEKFALSVVPKYMLGVSFIKFFPYNDATDAGGVVTDLLNINNSEVSHAFGLDVGVAYRPTSWMQFGVMARNVNSPDFEVSFVPQLGITSLTVDAQVRAGLALVPVRNLTLAFDVDLTENEIIALRNVRSRFVSLGAEYVIPFGRHVGLALRVGGYNNVSGTVNQDWAMTGGFGLRFGSFRIDASAAGSFADELIRTGTTTYDNFPTRLNAGLALSWEKSL